MSQKASESLRESQRVSESLRKSERVLESLRKFERVLEREGGGTDKVSVCPPPSFGGCLASLFALTLGKKCMIFIRAPFRSQVNGANDLMALTPLTLNKKPSSQSFLYISIPNVIVVSIVAISAYNFGGGNTIRSSSC